MPYIVTLIVLAFVAPHLIGWVRGVSVGRSAVRTHRDSVRMGVRMGRWQTVAAFTFGMLIAAKLF